MALVNFTAGNYFLNTMGIELTKYYNTFFSLSAAIATVLLMGCGAKKSSNSSEERETAGTSKEVEAKWQQESLHLMKELQAIKVTSKGTGNKRNVISFADSTLEKARAAAHRLFPVLSGKAKVKKDSNTEIIVSSSQSDGHLEDAILHAVGDMILTTAPPSPLILDNNETADPYAMGPYKIHYYVFHYANYSLAGGLGPIGKFAAYQKIAEVKGV